MRGGVDVCASVQKGMVERPPHPNEAQSHIMVHVEGIDGDSLDLAKHLVQEDVGIVDGRVLSDEASLIDLVEDIFLNA